MKNQPFCIAVCDDEPTDRKQIVTMTKMVCELENIYTEISSYESGEDLLAALDGGKPYHLFLLDVVMPGRDGMELARQIRRVCGDTPIVFISGNREMAMNGYEVSAIRYLGKPLRKEKLREAIAACCKVSESAKGICIPGKGDVRVVSPQDIFYIELFGRKSLIRQEGEVWESGLPLSKLEEMLKGRGFIRCHQSFLVNCRYIRSFRSSSIELTDGRSVPVSKHRIKEVRQFFYDYMDY